RIRGIDEAVAVVVGAVGARGLGRLGRVRGRLGETSAHRIAEGVGADVAVIAADRGGPARAGSGVAEPRQALVGHGAVVRRVGAVPVRAGIVRAVVPVVAVRAGCAAACDGRALTDRPHARVWTGAGVAVVAGGPLVGDAQASRRGVAKIDGAG